VLYCTHEDLIRPNATPDPTTRGATCVEILPAVAELDEVNRRVGVPRQELVHQALEVGRQVLDDDERHPARLRDVIEEGFEAAG